MGLRGSGAAEGGEALKLDTLLPDKLLLPSVGGKEMYTYGLLVGKLVGNKMVSLQCSEHTIAKITQFQWCRKDVPACEHFHCNITPPNLYDGCSKSFTEIKSEVGRENCC